MRIVHIEDFFHPNAGYQVNILAKYMSKLGHEVFIVTSEMEKIPEYLTSFFGKNDIEEKDLEYMRETGVKIIRIPLLKYISGRSVYHRNIFSIVDDLKPDILYVHGNDTLIGIEYILRSGRLNYPLITDSHMLEMASENRYNKVFRWVYRHFISPIIIKRNLTVIRTQNDNYVEKCLGIPITQAPWISTGSDLLIFHQDSIKKAAFRKEYEIDNKDMITLYIGKLDEAKGGKLLARAFEEKLVVSNGRKAILVAVGNTAGDYGKEVEAMFHRSENRIIRFPTQKYVDLPKFYQIGDIAIFPRQCSLSFYDAQACGLPVIAEDNNINFERLSHGNGLIFNEGNVEMLRSRLLEILEMDRERLNEMSQKARDFVEKSFNYSDIADQYMETLNRARKSFIEKHE